jgi:hypothetical protein
MLWGTKAFRLTPASERNAGVLFVRLPETPQKRRNLHALRVCAGAAWAKKLQK